MHTLSELKQKIEQATSQNCPKCNGSRKSSQIHVTGGQSSSLYVQFGGTFRNRDNRKLYVIACDDCNFVEIYTD